MPTLKPITIVGGGLAGLTLGIGLRQQGIPVTVWEAGHYPRHRVCGEFISGRGQDVLARLGLLESFSQAGAVCARTAAFYLGRRGSPVRPLATPGAVPVALRHGRAPGRTLPRVGRRVARECAVAGRGVRRGRRARQWPPPATARRRLPLVRAQGPCPQRAPGGGPRNARLANGLCRVLPPERRRGERLRPVPPARPANRMRRSPGESFCAANRARRCGSASPRRSSTRAPSVPSPASRSVRSALPRGGSAVSATR